MANYQAKGENNPRAKLTVEKVKEIRTIWELYKGMKESLPRAHNNRAVSAVKLARTYNLSPSAMKSLLAGETWRGIQ